MVDEGNAEYLPYLVQSRGHYAIGLAGFGISARMVVDDDEGVGAVKDDPTKELPRMDKARCESATAGLEDGERPQSNIQGDHQEHLHHSIAHEIGGVLRDILGSGERRPRSLEATTMPFPQFAAGQETAAELGRPPPRRCAFQGHTRHEVRQDLGGDGLAPHRAQQFFIAEYRRLHPQLRVHHPYLTQASTRSARNPALLALFRRARRFLQ